MSIKDLFGRKVKSYDDLSQDAESPEFIDKEIEERQTYVPPIDFATASNFVTYGSAELYYKNSIERIYGEYPYDGSLKEKTEFHLSSSYLDRWLFDNKYPKTTGYAVMGESGEATGQDGPGYGNGYASNEYIFVAGGLRTGNNFSETARLSTAFGQNAKYDPDNKREKVFPVDLDTGNTFEFWLKKDTVPTNGVREVILDLWNGEATSSSDYGRLTIELVLSAGAAFTATVQQGTTNGFFRTAICTSAIDTAFIADWNHYAVSFINDGSRVKVRFYVNGALNLEQNLGTTSVPAFTGLVNGYVGALQTAHVGESQSQGDGKLIGDLDELRFWKTRRTSRQINIGWNRQIGGGANTDDNTVDLGLYYKFNEGITTVSATDSSVLDYSGRIANGTWTGYQTTSRNTGSAINLSSNGTETGDPIIYSTHPNVSSLVTEMQVSGSEYDAEYGNQLYYTLPNWVVEQDQSGDKNLEKLYQIIGAYFDQLNTQIKAVTSLKDKTYYEEEYKAPTFARRLLEEKGFATSDILVENDILELFVNKDINSNIFQENIDEIKNRIYINIYNNLEGILKSKGTERSIRNFIRCFGIDDEIVKLNVYTDEGMHYLSDKSKETSSRIKYINFNESQYSSATIYQTSSANNTNTFISGSLSDLDERYSAFTLEADILVPFKVPRGESGFYYTPFLSSSVFGFHEAIPSDPSDYTWETNEFANLQVYLVRDQNNSPDARFVVENQDGSILLESDYIKGIYDNQHWNLALRIKPETYPYANVATNTSPTYDVEFYAVNYNYGSIENEISLSASISNASGSSYLCNPKRVYAGSHLLNFTGSVIEQTDVEIGAIRAWLAYAENDTIGEHNKDPMNYGLSKSEQSDNIFTIDNKQIPSSELSILHWEFDTVTGSDSSGNFIVEDFSSGSTDTIYGWVDNIIRREHRAKGAGFGANKTTFAEYEYIFSLKKELPEISYSSDTVTIKGEEQINFIKDEDVSDNFFILEKSLYAIVSEEMLKTFSTIQEFANLFGHAVDRYRMNYKSLDHARAIFFERVEQDIDFETFTNYYKWIDSSISTMVEQLYPASVRHSEGVIDVVESHILERNKYQNRPGLLTRYSSTEGSIRGVNELNYNWEFGHAPDYKNFENQNLLSLKIDQVAANNSRFRALPATPFNRFCVSFWMKLDTTPSVSSNFKVIRFDQSSNSNQFAIEILQGAGGTKLQMRSTTTDDFKKHITTNTFDFTNWTQVAVFFEGISLASADVDIYVNGALEASSVSSGAGTDDVLAIVDRIDLRQNTESDLFLDELNVITGSLSAEQFSELYNGGKYFNVAEDFSRRLDLIASYRMGDAPGDEVGPGGEEINDVRNDNNFTGLAPVPAATSALVEDVFDQGTVIGNTAEENSHCLWQKERKERTDIADRETIRQVLTTDVSASAVNLAQPDKTIYQGSAYATRRLSKPYRVGIELKNTIHGGINYVQKKDREFISTVVNPQGGLFPSGTPRNVFVVGTGPGTGINEKQKCDDPKPPNEKEYYDFTTQVGKYSDDSNGEPLSELDGFVYRLEGRKYYPFNLKKATVESGYNQQVSRLFKKDAEIVNLHSDSTDFTNEIPMQGPFTQTHVGGHQSRHVAFNKFDTSLQTEGGGATQNNIDDQYSRPERWRLKFGEHPTEDDRDGAMGFVSPSYGSDYITGDYIDTSREWAIYYRDGRVKRAVNVQNIKDSPTDNILGNYSKLYQVISSFGNNKRAFVKAEGFTLPPELSDFPETTQVLTRIDRASTWEVPSTASADISEAIIRTRFSAPGSRDTGTRGYLDVATGERSVYNSLNFRNLAVRGSGSEPAEEIRVVDQLGEGRGLRTLLSLHSGKFGYDPTFGSVSSATYVTQPSFYKQHRNTLVRAEISGYRNALKFNSVGDGVVRTNGVIDTSGATTGISISMWVRAQGSGSRILATDDGTNNFYISLDSSNVLTARFYEDGDPASRITSEFSSFANYYDKFVNLVVTVDLALTVIKAYVNGVELSATSTTTDGTVTAALIENNILIGAGFANGNANSESIISDFAIFETLLSAANVQSIYDNDVGGDYINSNFPDLNIFYKLGEEPTLTDFNFGQNLESITSFDSSFGGSHPISATPQNNAEDITIQKGRQIDIAKSKEFHNNALFTSLLPASDFQYSWVNAAISGSNWRDNQLVYGYAPRNGILSSSVGYSEAIVFPSASLLSGED
jgi:hypothetical protein